MPTGYFPYFKKYFNRLGTHERTCYLCGKLIDRRVIPGGRNPSLPPLPIIL